MERWVAELLGWDYDELKYGDPPMKQITNIPGSRPCPTCGAYNYDDESECQQCGASMRTPDQIPVQRRVQSPQR